METVRLMLRNISELERRLQIKRQKKESLTGEELLRGKVSPGWAMLGAALHIRLRSVPRQVL